VDARQKDNPQTNKLRNKDKSGSSYFSVIIAEHVHVSDCGERLDRVFGLLLSNSLDGDGDIDNWR